MKKLKESLRRLTSRLTEIKSEEHIEPGTDLDSLDGMRQLKNYLLRSAIDLFESNGKLEELVSKIKALIVEMEGWLHWCTCSYPGFGISKCEEDPFDVSVYRVRSGFQFMLDLFRGTGDTKLDETLNYIESEIIEEFDSNIKQAKEISNFQVEIIPNNLPNTHVWWFT